MKWIPLSDNPVGTGIEIIGFNIDWIDEDYNLRGIRICWLDELMGWVSARYCNNCDEYHTDTSGEISVDTKSMLAPTHYMHIPNTEHLWKT